MSIRIMNKVFESNLDSTKRFVLLALADHGNDDGKSIYPSMERIAHKTGLSERCVRETVAWLKTNNLLVTETQGGGAGYTNVYSIDVDALDLLWDSFFEKGAPRSNKGAPRSNNPEPDAPESSLTIINHIPETVTTIPVSGNVEKPKSVTPKFLNEDISPDYEPCDDDGMPIKDKRKKVKKVVVEIPPEKANHDSIKAFRAITGRNPHANQYDIIIKALGNAPDVRKLRELFEEWSVVRRYRWDNLAWITDWYVKGRAFKDNKPEWKPTEEY